MGKNDDDDDNNNKLNIARWPPDPTASTARILPDAGGGSGSGSADRKCGSAGRKCGSAGWKFRVDVGAKVASQFLVPVTTASESSSSDVTFLRRRDFW